MTRRPGNDARGRRPEDRLRDANPIPLQEVPPASAPQGRALFERIVETPLTEERKRRRRRRAALVLIPAAIAAAVAAGYEWYRHASKPLTVVCYQDVSLRSASFVVSAGEGDGSTACRHLWTDEGPFAEAGGGSAPPLAACVLETGVIGVFPARAGQDPCSTLGLARLATWGASDERVAITRVQEALVAEFLDRCVGEAEAVELAFAALERNGLSSWDVVPSPFTRARPCASLAGDVSQQRLRIVPIPDRSSS